MKIVWSSFCDGKYAILAATADNIKGKWTHEKLRFNFEGGHSMIFTALDGKKYFALHSPNTNNLERAVFMPYEEK